MATADTITLDVPDVSCDHCVRAVDQAVGGLNGVTTVTTDLGAKRVTVSYDPEEVNVDRIVAALDDAGYSVAGTGASA